MAPAILEVLRRRVVAPGMRSRTASDRSSMRSGQSARPTVMSTSRIRALRVLEGHRVSLALRGGRRLDDCELVSVGRAARRTLWIYTNGADAFVPVEDVMDVWEAA